MKKKDRAKEILKRLKKRYPTLGPFAEWKNPLQLVIVTMLSAQCTDERVNQVSKELFVRYRTVRDFADAKVSHLEHIIYSTGYYHSKAQYLKGIGQVLLEKFNGKVPEGFEDLLKLPGISKKSACIIGAKAFGKFYGVAVDTHVARVSPRLGLTKLVSRDMMAQDLERLFLPKEYLKVNEYLIMHGRAVCVPRNPKCEECVLQEICPSSNVEKKSIK